MHFPAYPEKKKSNLDVQVTWEEVATVAESYSSATFWFLWNHLQLQMLLSGGKAAITQTGLCWGHSCLCAAACELHQCMCNVERILEFIVVVQASGYAWESEHHHIYKLGEERWGDFPSCILPHNEWFFNFTSIAGKFWCGEKGEVQKYTVRHCFARSTILYISKWNCFH